MDLTDLKWNEVDSLSRDTPVVIPVAALEQHGRHMPVFTDSMLLGEVLRRVKEAPVRGPRPLHAAPVARQFRTSPGLSGTM